MITFVSKNAHNFLSGWVSSGRRAKKFWHPKSVNPPFSPSLSRSQLHTHTHSLARSTWPVVSLSRMLTLTVIHAYSASVINAFSLFLNIQPVTRIHQGLRCLLEAHWQARSPQVGRHCKDRYLQGIGSLRPRLVLHSCR